jgi:hypothetical protein
MTRVAAALVAVGLAVAAAPADGATIVGRTYGTNCSGKSASCFPIVSYRAAPGERNDVVVTETPGAPPVVRIHDAGAEIALDRSIGSWCTTTGPHDAVCTLESFSPYNNPIEFKLGDANDRLAVSEVSDPTLQTIVDGGTGADELRGGTSVSNATFRGGPGRDVVIGGAAGDQLSGGGSDDTIDGGPGVDWLGYGDRARPIVVDLAAGRGGEAGEHDAIANIENVNGGSGPDRLAGDAGPNELDGGPGDDVLRGRGGPDGLSGGDGIDRLFGGAGDDGLDVGGFRAGGSGFDIAGCGPGRDRVGGASALDEVRDDCEVAGTGEGDYRLFGPLRTPRSRVLQLNSHCSMTVREQQRHMVCQWRVALVTPGGAVVGVKAVRTHRLPYRRIVRIAPRLNKLGRRLLIQRGFLRVTVRLASGLTRQHGPIPTPATTAFTTVIRRKGV